MIILLILFPGMIVQSSNGNAKQQHEHAMDAVENELKTQLSTIQQQYHQCKTSLATTRAALQSTIDKHATTQVREEVHRGSQRLRFKDVDVHRG